MGHSADELLDAPHTRTKKLQLCGKLVSLYADVKEKGPKERMIDFC